MNGVTTYFNTKDGVILSQTDGTNTWYFQYDTSGTPLGFVLNGTQYFYITNQMGDVLAITDTEGNIVGNYEYDAWGGVTLADTDIAKQNPLRYRGYYYDNETGYYYFQSRYYDPSICRFINADIAEISQKYKDISAGTNLFVYCNNCAVNFSDCDGYDFVAATLATFAWPLVLDFISFMAVYLWYVIAVVIAVGITVAAVKKVVDYAKKTSKGKKAKDSGKNEPHGNEAEKRKAEKQAKELKEKAKNAKSKKEKKKLIQKAKNVMQHGQKAKKGETHHRK